MKRRWLQIHLSTAIVMMMVAELLVHLNMRYRYASGLASGYFVPPNESMVTIVRGWPFAAVTYLTLSDAIREESFEWTGDDSVFYRARLPDLKLTDMNPNDATWTFAQPPEWRFGGLLGDAVFAIGMLTIIAAVVERFIRRREKLVG